MLTQGHTRMAACRTLQRLGHAQQSPLNPWCKTQLIQSKRVIISSLLDLRPTVSPNIPIDSELQYGPTWYMFLNTYHVYQSICK